MFLHAAGHANAHAAQCMAFPGSARVKRFSKGTLLHAWSDGQQDITMSPYVVMQCLTKRLPQRPGQLPC